MLPKVVPLFHGYPEELSCKAEGYPPPKIQWFYSADKFPRVSGDMLVVTEAGYYNCTATNEVNTTFRVVEVILKGNNKTKLYPVHTHCCQNICKTLF